MSAVVWDVESEFPTAEIESESEPEIPVRAHPQLQQAIYELLENAVVHSTQSEPKVTIEIETGEHVRLHISDDGPGFPEAERRILSDGEPITQMNHTSGLGLWLVRTIVQRSQGMMDIGQSDRQGTRITLQLLSADGSDG